MKRKILVACSVLASIQAIHVNSQQETVERQVYWGDTHLHTSNSFDAFLNRNMTAGPDTAYRYAKGQPVVHPYHQARVQIETPLDFLVIADHAEFLGAMPTINYEGIPTEGLGFIDKMKALYTQYIFRDVMEEDTGTAAFVKFLPDPVAPEVAARGSSSISGIPNGNVMAKNTWLTAINLADQYNDPGTFTTFIGWEWSSIPGGANLHRVVFTSSDATVASTYMPYSSQQSQYPEDLWAWLDETTEKTGAEFIAIPHNSNISKGYMFPEITIKGEAVTKEYVETRARWEPVAEATQIKGDSETIGLFSPDDEFADFETYKHYIEKDPPEYAPKEGDYIRSGLKRGMELELKFGTNPYKFGLIGSTDSHTGLASAEENNFHGKLARDSIPANKITKTFGATGTSGWAMSASGLAAVWAEHNDRESIMAAFKRKEVYASTGPRIGLRFFGGWNFTEEDINATDFAATAYGKGVPMGGDLTGTDSKSAPAFLIQAAKDPKSGNLDRLQVIKATTDASGDTIETVYDVVWAGDRIPDENGKIAAIGNTVDLETGHYTNSIGAKELIAYWQDPDFKPSQRAFYYARVLEIPTARHALKDAIALTMTAPTVGPATIQERAYSSPIWYTP